MQNTERVVLQDKDVSTALGELALAIANNAADAPVAVVGIRRGGEHLARRLAAQIGQDSGESPPLGFVDITLYRDDGFGPSDWPRVGVTEIPFDLKTHTVVLVDDVLYTGRTVRAGIDAILDYGRPRAIRLAVLVDRGLRELPIRADYVGNQITTNGSEHVDVRLREGGWERDEVIVSPVGARRQPAGADASEPGGEGGQ